MRGVDHGILLLDMNSEENDGNGFQFFLHLVPQGYRGCLCIFNAISLTNSTNYLKHIKTTQNIAMQVLFTSALP